MECKKNDCFNCPYPDCINDYVKKTYPRKKQWIAHQTEYVSKRAKRRAAEGLCTKCGKRPPRPGYRTCGECAMKSRRASNEHKWRNGWETKKISACALPKIQGCLYTSIPTDDRGATQARSAMLLADGRRSAALAAGGRRFAGANNF